MKDKRENTRRGIQQENFDIKTKQITIEITNGHEKKTYMARKGQ